MAEIRQSISNVVTAATNASKEALRTAKVNLDIAKEESKIKGLTLEMGKLAKEIYDRGEGLGAEFDAVYDKITAAEDRVAELRERLRAGKVASSSGEPIPTTVNYSDEGGENGGGDDDRRY